MIRFIIKVPELFIFVIYCINTGLLGGSIYVAFEFDYD